jgi:hypothetical protein
MINVILILPVLVPLVYLMNCGCLLVLTIATPGFAKRFSLVAGRKWGYNIHDWKSEILNTKWETKGLKGRGK